MEECKKDLDRFKNADKFELKNLEKMSQLEGEMKFKDEEIREINQ